MISPILSSMPVGPLRRVREFLKHPVETQANLLRNLLRQAADTEWGRRYGFAELAQVPNVIEAYQNRVPLCDYTALRTDVERIRDGTANVIWPGRFKYFAASSGTTSTGRIIPVSEAMLRADRDFGLATALNYIAATGRTRILFGKHLTLPGWIEDDRRPGTRIAQISALLTEFAAGTTRPWQAIPNTLGFIENWETKMATIADHVIPQDIRLVAVAPSWGQVLFRKVIARYNATHPTPIQAVGEIWPNLQAVITGGVALSGYREILSAQIGLDGVDLVETYGASEGFFSFQNDLADPAMLLHLDCGVFLEYVRRADLGQEAPRRYHIGEVEVGVPYAPFVTTNSGLWAYGIGDVIRFTQADPHKILVAGRTTEMLDQYGEAVFGEEAHQALQKACAQTGVRVLEYHITHTKVTQANQPPAHQWIIEFDRLPPDLQTFADTLDAALAAAGHHYQDRREGLAFGPPDVVPIPPGTFYRWMEVSGKRVGVQTKVPRMREDRELAEAVLQMLGASPGNTA